MYSYIRTSQLRFREFIYLVLSQLMFREYIYLFLSKFIFRECMYQVLSQLMFREYIYSFLSKFMFREYTSVLLSQLYLKVVSQRDIGKAFDYLLRTLNDLVLDTPDASTILGNYIARAIADDCIPPKFLKSYKVNKSVSLSLLYY